MKTMFYLPLYLSWYTISYIWFDHSKPSMDSTGVSFWHSRWGKSASIGDWFILTESKKFRFYWGFLHHIQVTCTIYQAMLYWQKVRSIDHFHLSKLGPKYSVFVSTFHATRLAISNWKMPYLSTLFEIIDNGER